MQKILLILFLFASSLYSQTEVLTKVVIGNYGGDITNQPISVPSEFSHSQTLYYPEQLGFVGEINELRFKTVFSSDQLTNSSEWIVKLGLSDKYEFEVSDGFINSSSFLNVFSGTVVKDGYDVIISFTEPFFYDGSQNLVLDIKEVQPGKGSSSVGFQGVKNFSSPPKRSRMTFTTNGTTQTLIENSYAVTEFYGTFTICARIQNPTIGNITINSADVHLQPNANIPEYRYNINKASEPIPSTYELTTDEDILLTDLQPATDYIFNVKADCEVPGSKYYSVAFTTKIVPFTFGSSVTFDENVNPGTYYLSAGRYAKSEISEMAGTFGSKGLLFRSAETTRNWNTYDIWRSNPHFISGSKFLIEVPLESTVPVFKFDLKQDVESFFRIKINSIVYDFQFSGPINPEGVFENITIDLSSYKGETIELDFQHISKYSGTLPGYIRTAYVDNVFFQEADCAVTEEISVSSTSTTSLTINGPSSSNDAWEVLVIRHDENPAGTTALTFNGFPFDVQNLEVATAYDFYIRKTCGNGFSAWKKLFESTWSETIQIPHQENFQTFNEMYAPLYNEASRIELESFPASIALAQKKNHSKWVGGIATTEEQAWNENKDFLTALKFRVDAVDLNTLTMELRFKLKYYYNSQTSWFRILINGEQFGDSFNATGGNPNSQILTVDLTEFTGQMVEVVLQHVGRSSEYSVYGHMDAVLIHYVNFFGEIGCAHPTDLTVDNITETTADIEWIEGGEEDNWIVKYGLQNFDPNTSGQTLEISGNPQTALSNLEPETNYDVYIRAICDAESQSSWNGPVMFTTEAIVCTAPDTIVIENITDETAQVFWTPAGEEAQWEVLYGEAGFDTNNEGIRIIANYPDATLETLSPNTDYEVYVRSVCSEYIKSEWSGPVGFTTTFLNVSDFQKLEIKVFPNPVEYYVHIQSEIILDHFTLYDIQGREIKSGAINSDSKIDLSSISDGFYLLSLKSVEGAMYTQRLIKK